MKALSLRTKFLIGSLVLVMLLGLGIIVFVRAELMSKVEADLQRRGLSIARDFAVDSVNPLLTENVLNLQMIARDHKQNEEDIEYLFVENSIGEVLAHTFGEKFPADLREANPIKAGQEYSIRLLVTEKGEVFDIATPILKGDLGTAHVGMSAEPVRKSIAGIIKDIVWIIIGVLALGSGIAVVFAVRITKPLAELAKAANSVGRGDLGRRIEVKTADEIGQLGVTFNKMVEDLQKSMIFRSDLEAVVHCRTAELTETNARLQALIQAMPDAVFFKDPSGRYMLVNKALEELLGARSEMLIGKTDDDFTPPELAEGRKKSDQALMKSGGLLCVEDTLTGRDGEKIFLDSVKAPIYGFDGSLLGIVGVSRDVTKRKKAEGALRSNEERLSRAQQIAHVGDWEWELATNTVHWSDELYRIYGYAPREVSPDYGLLVNAMHPDSKEEFLKAIDAALKGQRPFDMNYLFYRKDGSVANLHTIGNVIYDADGRPERMMGVVQDITEQKLAEEALRDSEQRFRSLFDMATDGIILMAPQQNGAPIIVDVNNATCVMNGYEREALLGKPTTFLDVVSPQDISPIVERLMTGETVTFEIQHARKDGSVFPVEVSARLIQIGGDPFILGISRDITARKLSEQALRLSEERLSRAQQMAHEGNWEKNFVTGQLYWSEEIYRIYGVDPAQFTPTTDAVMKAMHPEDREPFIKAMKAAVNERKFLDMDYRLIRPDGTVRTVHTISEVSYNDQGKPLLHSGTIQDVTERRQIAEALRRSEAMLQAIIDTEPECVKLLDPEARLIMMNRAGLEMIEVDSLEQVKGQCVGSMIASEYRERFMELTKNIFQGQSGTLLFEMIGAKGTRRWLDTHAVPFRNEKDEIVALLAVTRDVTERKRTEEALKRAHAQLHALIHAIPDMVVFKDVAGRHVIVNKAVEKITGHSKDDITGKTIEDLLPPGPAAVCRKSDEEAMQRSVSTHAQERLVRKDGREAYFDMVKAPMVDPEGNVIGLVAVGRDITESRQMEEALRKSEANYRSLLEQASDGIAVIDQHGRYLDVNSRMCDMLGYSREEFLKLTVKDVLAPEELSVTSLRLSDLLAGKTILSERLMRRKDGSTFPMEISAKKIPDGRLCGIHRDISERRRVETALRKSHVELEVLVQERTAELRMINDQLSMFSSYLQEAREKERTDIAREIHDELGQALTALKMDLSWLKRRLPKNQKPLLEKGASMSELVESTIQTVKKISSELRPGVLDHLGLTAAIEWQAEEFQKRTGVPCDVSIVPEEIIPDRSRSTTIFRIFQETLTNITRHAKATAVSVRLEQEDHRLVLKVNDNGKGITEKQLSDPKSLGLMGIRERAASWGGSVNVKGVRGGGTTVTVHIPLDRTGGSS